MQLLPKGAGSVASTNTTTQCSYADIYAAASIRLLHSETGHLSSAEQIKFQLSKVRRRIFSPFPFRSENKKIKIKKCVVVVFLWNERTTTKSQI
jgi:hypothetical protein